MNPLQIRNSKEKTEIPQRCSDNTKFEKIKF